MKVQNSAVLAGFRANKKPSITGNLVRLREKKLSDVRNDYKWQSDPELARLDAAPVLMASFPIYLLDYAAEVRRPRPDRFPMAIDTLDGKHIGNCSCYDIDVKRGEAQLGIMIGDRDYWNRGYGTDTVIAMTDFVFRNTSLGRIYLKTLDWNLRAQKCFRNAGFEPCGDLRRNGFHFILMDVTRDRWERLPVDTQNAADER